SNRGHVVWWDRLIGAGALWSEEISRALSQARAVVVLWSNASVTSAYVRAEARTAADRQTLIPAMIEACEPPMPFGEYEAIDLTKWRDDGDFEAIDVLSQTVDGVQIGRPRGSPSTVVPTLRRTTVFGLSALLGFWTDLFALATQPKTFLLRKWHDPNLFTS